MLSPTRPCAEKFQAVAPAFTLYYGGSTTALATILPFRRLPGMFVVCWPDGSVSDFGNLSRACDAAFVSAAHGRDWRLLRWRPAAKRTSARRWASPSGLQAASQERQS